MHGKQRGKQGGQEPYTDVNRRNVTESPIAFLCVLSAGVPSGHGIRRAGGALPNPVLAAGSVPLCRQPWYGTVPLTVRLVGTELTCHREQGDGSRVW